jgi:hypothetical protein
MKHIKLFESMTEIEVEKICKKYNITNWTLNPDGTVDVNDSVYLSGQKLSKLPLKFGRVTGDFKCYSNQLTSLEGCPTEVGLNFYCRHNKLTSLEGCPKEISGSFWCDYNQLTSLKGCSREIGRNFYCYKNQLTSLEGCPTEIRGAFDCSYNKLTSLEGCPTQIGGDFSCHYNQLTTLEGCPTQIGAGFYCDNNLLTSLEGCPTEIAGSFWCDNNQLTSLKGAPEYIEGQVNFIPNNNLPVYIKQILKLNDNNKDIQKYILKWQKDYSIWRRDGSFNQARFILMMEDAGDELKNLKLPE